MKKVLLAQLPHPSLVDRNVPLAAGFLKAYAAQAGLLDEIGIEILDVQSDHSGCQMIIDTIVAMQPDVIGFSLYIWNVDRTLYMINKLRTALPELIVIVGGPEVNPLAANLFITKDIDLAIFGEGEKAFVEVLRYVLGGKPKLENIAGIGYRKNKGFVFNRPGMIVENLETLPSPYLLGFIDPANYREMILFTMRGCLQGCSYCAWSGRGRLRAFSMERLHKELDLARCSGKVMIISIVDSAFNTSPVFVSFCKMIQEINQDGLLKLHCFVRADLIDRQAARLLKESNFAGVEVGLQTTNSQALANIQRSMDLEDFLRGIRLLTEEGVPVKVDTILGLPGDTLANFENTMRFVENHHLDPIIFNLSLGYGVRLRKRSEQFGIRIQSAPPYYVLETGAFPQKDLQMSMERYAEASADFDRMNNLNYPVILSDSENKPVCPTSLDMLDQQAGGYPIRSLVLSINAQMKQVTPIGDLADFVAHRAANNFSVLLKGPLELLASSLYLLKILLGRISEVNPFITWDIHIETQEGIPEQPFVNEIKSFIHKPKVFLDFRDELFPSNLPYIRRRAVNLFAQVPYPPITAPQLDRANLIYTIKLGTDELEKAKELLHTDGSGLLIDFIPGTPVENMRATMHLLNIPGKIVFFKDWVIQRFWEQEFLHITPEYQSRFEILADQDCNLTGKYFDESDLIWDAIFRWQMIKPEYSNIDLSQLIIEKISTRVIEQGTV